MPHLPLRRGKAKEAAKDLVAKARAKEQLQQKDVEKLEARQFHEDGVVVEPEEVPEGDAFVGEPTKAVLCGGDLQLDRRSADILQMAMPFGTPIG